MYSQFKRLVFYVQGNAKSFTNSRTKLNDGCVCKSEKSNIFQTDTRDVIKATYRVSERVNSSLSRNSNFSNLFKKKSYEGKKMTARILARYAAARITQL